MRKRLERSPRRSANLKKLKISDRSIRLILKNDFQVKPFKIQKVNDILPRQQQVRLERAEELLRFAESGQFPIIALSDGTIFQIEQFVNTQNDRFYLTDRLYEILSHRLATRRQHTPQVMVWTAVNADGRSPIVFIEPGVKANTKYNR